jgi:hypothetical protein
LNIAVEIGWQEQLLWSTIVSSNLLPILIGLLVIAGWACRLVWLWAREKVRKRAAESWPIAEAAVQTFYVVHHSDSHSGYSQAGRLGYIPVLQYSCLVNEERYSGEFNLGVWESTQDSAQATAKGWLGEKIRIRYKPSDPAVSVWLEQDGAPAGASFTEPYGSDDGIIDLELNK